MRPDRPKRRYSIDMLLGWPLVDRCGLGAEVSASERLVLSRSHIPALLGNALVVPKHVVERGIDDALADGFH
ncbi:hypothetical protein BDS110ZK4_46910 [Bradyrhizobium diazoefficiens]|uniref:Uncharacterized protein n=1 Tax=Bradyrhizobium diazoefficiens TaxID=1355477 RepID=A0A809X7D3_9BRAD|nr:hypothetical protein XF1B_57010 [Bradyrhizobium diazoefficiens]BCE49284.1 hypothetical protein XF4B_56330 [Bradyrhizobium diazoefficiens]BCE92794.1 hypothetical protein XF10B_55920 [Bradyrhizobium diazoefficiens]BCF27725.1 hypothetical protein XF14B_56770 [Bradyrhizobium diazoefficiens]